MAQAVERILGKDEVGGSSPPISSKIPEQTIVCSGIFILIADLKQSSKFFVQLAAGKIWEKAPVGLSIDEKKVRLSAPRRLKATQMNSGRKNET